MSGDAYARRQQAGTGCLLAVAAEQRAGYARDALTATVPLPGAPDGDPQGGGDQLALLREEMAAFTADRPEFLPGSPGQAA